jgi:hypothetical protein
VVRVATIGKRERREERREEQESINDALDHYKRMKGTNCREGRAFTSSSSI